MPSIESSHLIESTNEFCNEKGRLIRWTSRAWDLVFLRNRDFPGTNQRWLEPLEWPDLETASAENRILNSYNSFSNRFMATWPRGNMAAAQIQALDNLPREQRKRRWVCRRRLAVEPMSTRASRTVESNCRVPFPARHLVGHASKTNNTRSLTRGSHRYCYVGI